MSGGICVNFFCLPSKNRNLFWKERIRFHRQQEVTKPVSLSINAREIYPVYPSPLIKTKWGHAKWKGVFELERPVKTDQPAHLYAMWMSLDPTSHHTDGEGYIISECVHRLFSSSLSAHSQRYILLDVAEFTFSCHMSFASKCSHPIEYFMKYNSKTIDISLFGSLYCFYICWHQFRSCP